MRWHFRLEVHLTCTKITDGNLCRVALRDGDRISKAKLDDQVSSMRLLKQVKHDSSHKILRPKDRVIFLCTGLEYSLAKHNSTCLHSNQPNTFRHCICYGDVGSMSQIHRFRSQLPLPLLCQFFLCTHVFLSVLLPPANPPLLLLPPLPLLS